MIIKCKARDVLDGSIVISDERINNLQDYRNLRAAVVSTSETFFNDLRIVKDGHIELYAYNHEAKVLEYLMGDISLEELYTCLTPAE